MSRPLATYSFLPWLRQGLANQIQSNDFDAAVKLRARVKVQLELKAEKLAGGPETKLVEHPVALFGPGDIQGIESRAIVRVEPRDWTTNFEPNYLPHIEFYDEDLPWRYTPAAPDTGRSRLRPWIMLVVLEEGEFTDGTNIHNKPLPYIDVPDLSVFPPAEQLWAWAHVHVNRNLAANDAEFTSKDMAAVIPRLRAVLDENPDLAYSRIVSPRKLDKNTAYHAFLVPVFETGRLAGLGLDPKDDLSATFSAWAAYSSKPEGQSFPYYYRWFFRTGTTGDFESLVRLLKPKSVDSRVGTRDMDVQAPGSNIRGLDKPELGGILKLGGALRIPRKDFERPGMSGAQAELEKYENWAVPFPQPIQKDLAKLINLADDYAALSAESANSQAGIVDPEDPDENDPDPLITPPLYGTWHALTRRLLEERDGAPISPNNNWVHELNLDPRFRVGAGFGTRVVQDHQEKYMDAAWEQIGKVLEANQRIRLGQIAKEVSFIWYDRHLRPLLGVSQQKALLMMVPLNKRVLANGFTVHHHLAESFVQPAMTSTALRRIMRPRGRLLKAMPFDATVTPDDLISRVNEGEVSAAPPNKTLLDIVGLHSGSVEFSQRYAESAQQLYNRLNLSGLGRLISPALLAALQRSGTELLTRLGYTGNDAPDVLNKFFFGKHNLLKGPVVDDKPLSETDRIRAYTADGKNYLQWLIDAANSSLNAVYVQAGFLDDKPPQALLYLMLRHALQLGYRDVSLRLHESVGLLSAEAVRLARREEPFIHIREQAQVSESRYQLLYRAEPEITGSATMPVGEFIGSLLSSFSLESYLSEQVQALERLNRDHSTARLERAFAEYVDCCTYRLDAWLLGLMHFQLAAMRNLRDGDDAQPTKGIYLGAYAWLEGVRPENKVLTPVQLDDVDLAEVFGDDDEPPLQRDSANQGYVHAPSLNQAVAAAVLRNGYISNASRENRQTMAVNLTSERVRAALAMIEGIRGGQSLGALLGYQFERGLHDRHNLAEVDKFIFDVRREFPLVGNRLASTKVEDGPVEEENPSIEALEARNVVDGLALVNHVKSGKALPPATGAEADAINAEVERLLQAHDAVADLALAEGVYQAVLGNYDRVASTYDAFSKGTLPPEPQVVETPASGIGLTHRVGLHLEIDPTVLPAMTPRAQAEPALNRWLAGILPTLGDVACMVSFHDAATNATAERQVTLGDLNIQPADLLQILRDDSEQAMSELDDRIVRFTVVTHSPRPDVPVVIRYMEKTTAPLSIFEVMPLARHLRRITQTSRPLKPSDLALANETTGGEDAAVFVDKQRLVHVRDGMQTLRTNLADFLSGLEGPLADLNNRRGEIVASVDNYVRDLASLLARAAGFAIPQTGWGFAYDFKQRVFRAVLAQCAELVARWNERLAEFNGLMLLYTSLPTSAMDLEKFDLLLRAERLVSTTATNPLPASPDDFQMDLGVKHGAFVAKLAQFDEIQETNRTSVTSLLGDANALLPITAFDSIDFSFTEQEDEAVRFAEDAVSVAGVIVAEIDRRLADSKVLLDEHDAAAQATEGVKALEGAAKVLLGDDFLIIPEFDFGAAHGDEVEKAIGASRPDALFDYLTNTMQTDFPVDTWLYGVARVREKMRAWEQMVMLTEGFGRPEPELTALQLPFMPDDHWLALEFPPEAKLDTDRLLYTAHFASAFQKASRQCGLLIDEWTEVIPSSDATTGITFHYDRPNCEPPQTMLLVTPTQFRGAWQWEDLVDALNETLDLAKRRAVEPVHMDQTAYARFLPATIMAVTVNQLTISVNLAINNFVLQEE